MTIANSSSLFSSYYQANIQGVDRIISFSNNELILLNNKSKKEIKFSLGNLDHIFDELNKADVLAINIPNNSKKILNNKNFRKLLSFNQQVRIFIEKVSSDNNAILQLLADSKYDIYSFDDCIIKKLNSDDFKTSEQLSIYALSGQSASSYVFFIHDSNFCGGAQKCAFELVKDMIAKYGSIFQIVLPREGEMVTAFEQIGAPVKVINYCWWVKEQTHLMADSLSNIVKNYHFFNIIDFNFVMTQTMVIPWGAVLANLLKKPHIWNIREYGEEDHSLHFSLNFQETLEFIKNNSSHITCCGKNLQHFLFPGLNNDSIGTAYSHIKIKKSFKKENNQNNKIKIIMPSNITRNKGQMEAIQALSLIINEKKLLNISLLLVGNADKDYLYEIKKYIKAKKIAQHINIAGFSDDVYSHILNSDIVLTCSKNEAQGRTTIEGQLLGKPVIVSNTGENSVLVKEKINGLIYKYGDASDLAEKIIYFIKNPSLIKQYGKNAQQTIHKILEKNYQEDIIYQAGIKLKSSQNKKSSCSSLDKIFDLFSQFNNYHQQKIIIKKDKETLFYTDNVLIKSNNSFIANFNFESNTINNKVIYMPIENAICKLQISKISIANEHKVINFEKESLLNFIKTSIKPDKYNWYSFDHDRPTFELSINESINKIIIYGKIKIINPLSTFHQKNVLINDLKDEINQLRDSTAYKVGSFITNGPKSLYLKIKKLMKKNESK